MNLSVPSHDAGVAASTDAPTSNLTGSVHRCAFVPIEKALTTWRRTDAPTGRWSRRPKAFWPVARARGLIPYPGMKESSEVRHVA